MQKFLEHCPHCTTNLFKKLIQRIGNFLYFWNRIYTWLVVREAFGLLAKFIKGYLVPCHNIGKRRITDHVWKAYFFVQKSGYKLSSFWYHCMAEHIYNPITAMGALAMFTFQLDNSLRSKHCRHPVAIMWVVDSFEPCHTA